MLKFNFKKALTIPNKELHYLIEEHSFYMGVIYENIEIEWILNDLSLGCSNNRIVHLSGFCGLSKNMFSNVNVPKYSKGILMVEHDFEEGLAYSINNKNLPVYVNAQSGWVCIGDPLVQCEGVEFLPNCVAVISTSGDFISLWLKPKQKLF
jgi:hypothetical protein